VTTDDPSRVIQFCAGEDCRYRLLKSVHRLKHEESKVSTHHCSYFPIKTAVAFAVIVKDKQTMRDVEELRQVVEFDADDREKFNCRWNRSIKLKDDNTNN